MAYNKGGYLAAGILYLIMGSHLCWPCSAGSFSQQASGQRHVVELFQSLLSLVLFLGFPTCGFKAKV